MAFNPDDLASLRLDVDVIQRVAAIESNFGLAYMQEGRLAAAGTLLTSAACHFALIDSSRSVETFGRAVDAYWRLGHNFAIIAAIASGDERLLRHALQAPRHNQIRLRFHREDEKPSPRESHEREPQDELLAAPSDDEYAACALGEVFRVIWSEDALGLRENGALANLVEELEIPDRPLWSGLITAYELVELCREVEREGFSQRGEVVLSRAEEALSVYQSDDFHWSNLVGPPVYAVEVLALSQLMIGATGERVSRYPASIARSLRLAVDLRAVTSPDRELDGPGGAAASELLTAWEEIQDAMSGLASRIRDQDPGVDRRSPRTDLASLQDAGLIEPESVAAVSRLEALQSRVAKGTHDPTPSEAAAYADSAAELTAAFSAQAAAAGAGLSDLMQRWRTYSPQNKRALDRIVAGLAKRGYMLRPSQPRSGGRPVRTYVRTLAPNGKNIGYLNSTTFLFVAAQDVASVRSSPDIARSGRYPAIPLDAPSAVETILAAADEYRNVT